MLCPKCGYNSFEYNLSCPKCRRDLTAIRRQLFITEPKPGQVDFFSFLSPGPTFSETPNPEKNDIQL
jgi:uncharacterized OB-fold protein